MYVLFSNLFHRFILVLLDDKQKDKSGGVNIPWILPHLDMVYSFFRFYYICLESVLEYFQVQIRSGELW